jgi:predicted deacylase
MHLRDLDPLAFEFGTKTRLRLVAGDPASRPADIDLTVVRGAKAGKVLFALAGIHGDEYEGPHALWKLIEYLRPEELSGTVMVLPVANWQAFQIGQRCSSIDLANLNRAFPGNLRGSYTEILAHDLFECLVRPSNMVVDLHSGGVISNFYPTVGYIRESSAAALSREACWCFGTPTIWSMPGTTGVMTTEAARVGKLAIGAEYGGEGRLNPTGVDCYSRGLIHTLQFLNMLPGAPPENRDLPVVEGDFVAAQTKFGRFSLSAAVGDLIHSGQLLATAIDFETGEIEEFHSAFDGLLLSARPRPVISQGDWAVCPARMIEGRTAKPKVPR